MKTKLFSLILSFTIISVAATAINCGCAFAVNNPIQTSEQVMSGHCDQREEDQSTADSEECCLGCKLTLGALNTHHLNFQNNRSDESFSPHAYLAKHVFQVSSRYHLVSSQFSVLDARGVSIPSFKEPIYLILESFLI